MNSTLAAVTVLGAGGFIGRALTRRLLESGCYVLAVTRDGGKAKFPLDPNLEIIGLSEYLALIKYYKSKGTFQGVNPTSIEKCSSYVFNCITAYERDGVSQEEIQNATFLIPRQILGDLPRGTKFINLNTNLPSGVSFYAQQKELFAKLARQACQSSDTFDFIDVKIEHVYGPGQGMETFCGWLIHSFINGIEKIELTDGKQFRDFIYLEDVISGLVAVASAANRRGYRLYELGSGSSIQIRDFVRKVRQKCSGTTELQFGARPYRVSEPVFTCADLTEISGIGWKPLFDIDTGIALTVKAASS